MLRATSEIAVAISVWSVEEKPSWPASCRPAWRAAMMSISRSIWIVTSLTAPPSSSRAARGLLRDRARDRHHRGSPGGATARRPARLLVDGPDADRDRDLRSRAQHPDLCGEGRDHARSDP